MYLSWLDGKAHVWHAPAWLPFDGSTLMLLSDALIPVAGTAALVAFAILVAPFYRRKPAVAA
jgi:hypothetical protein